MTRSRGQVHHVGGVSCKIGGGTDPDVPECIGCRGKVGGSFAAGI